MKKIVSLMVSVMMLINPLVGVLADGESTQAPVTETVGVVNDETKTVEAIDVSGSDYQEGAWVIGDGASAALTVENEIQVTSMDNQATGAYVSSNGEQGSASLNAGDVTVKSEGEGGFASSVNASSSGEQSNTTVVVENVSSTSTDGNATAVSASASGDTSTTDVTTGNVKSDGKNGATGISAYADSGSGENAGSNKVIVNAGDVSATSTDRSATAVSASAFGDTNTTDVTTGDISSKGKYSVTGIDANSNSGSGENAGSNKVIVNAGDVSATSTDRSATAVSASASGDKNTTNVTTGDISSDGKNGATGISAYADSGSSENAGSDNKVIVNAGDVSATSTDSSATAVSARASGDKNTTDVTIGDVSANGKYSATGISGSASNEGNIVDVTSNNITVKATDTDGSSSSATATGVRTISTVGGKQTVTTGDIDVISISKSEFDEQTNYERSASTVRGVEATAEGKKSEVIITTGNVSAEATADGGSVFDSSRYTTNASGSAVALTANNSGNIFYTADGDVVLTLTRNIEERDVEESPSIESPSPYTFEEEAGTFTGTSNAGIKISVVGKDSEVSAIIKGNVEANSTINYSDYDEPISGNNVAGVVVGDRKIGTPLRSTKAYNEDGSLHHETDENGNTTYYKKDGTIELKYNVQTGITTFYRENGTKHYEEDPSGNKIYYDENGNVTNKTGDLMGRTPEASEAGTANVKIEGDVTSNGVGLEVVPTLSDGNVNVIVEGTIKGEKGAVLVNDNVNAGNFNLTVWKIDPATYYEYDENGEIVGEEKSYLEVKTPEGEGYRDDTAAAEELLKKVQYIIKVDPNITNAHVNLDGTTKFTDFTGEEYDIAHEDDKVVVRISADSGYQITGAFNGEGKEETLLRDGNGNYYIIVPRGGGVYLTATVMAISQDVPEEEDRNAPTRVKSNDKDNGLASLAEIESNNRVAIPAVNRLLRLEERKALAALSPMQQLLVVMTKAGFSDAAAASGFTLSEEAKKLVDSLDVDLRKAVQTVYSYENGVKVKWYYVEMVLPGNQIARVGFRQIEDGTWIVKLL